MMTLEWVNKGSTPPWQDVFPAKSGLAYPSRWILKEGPKTRSVTAKLIARKKQIRHR